LAATGLDGAIVLTFDATLAGLSAEEFVEHILVERLGIAGAVIGFNFHFG
jgi:riboflavin kinase/FMN adenylyltransferase